MFLGCNFFYIIALHSHFIISTHESSVVISFHKCIKGSLKNWWSILLLKIPWLKITNYTAKSCLESHTWARYDPKARMWENNWIFLHSLTYYFWFLLEWKRFVIYVHNLCTVVPWLTWTSITWFPTTWCFFCVANSRYFHVKQGSYSMIWLTWF